MTDKQPGGPCGECANWRRISANSDKGPCSVKSGRYFDADAYDGREFVAGTGVRFICEDFQRQMSALSLLDCPFHGPSGIDSRIAIMRRPVGSNQWVSSVVCFKCGGSGPVAMGESEPEANAKAAEGWNRRSLTERQQPLGQPAKG